MDMKVVDFEGADLQRLREYLRDIVNDEGVYRVRVAFDWGQFKIKANERVWSPPMGREAE